MVYDYYIPLETSDDDDDVHVGRQQSMRERIEVKTRRRMIYVIF
jgi:hypothetical protein